MVFDDYSYRWGFLLRFRIDADSIDDREVLKALIALPRYRAGIGSLSDLKALAEKKEFSDEREHGPYPLSAITPQAFTQTDADAVRRELTEFAANDEDEHHVHPVVLSRYTDYVEALVGNKPSLYRLTVDPSLVTEWGWIYSLFSEHVSINHLDQTVTLLMSGAD